VRAIARRRSPHSQGKAVCASYFEQYGGHHGITALGCARSLVAVAPASKAKAVRTSNKMRRFIDGSPLITGGCPDDVLLPQWETYEKGYVYEICGLFHNGRGSGAPGPADRIVATTATRDELNLRAGLQRAAGWNFHIVARRPFFKATIWPSRVQPMER